MSLMWSWLTDGSHWHGNDGVLLRLAEHLWYSGLALGIAALIAVPLGLFVGHTGHGRWLAVNLTGALRAMPSLGLLFIAYMWLGDHLRGEGAFLYPTELVLVALAVPPILAGTYAGVEQVDAAARDAARGMGMTGRELLLKVELPCALPLLVSGIRSAALQVIATATLAAVLGLGGLGRFLLDGLATRDYGQMAGGAALVACLALLVDLLLAALQRVVVSPGLTGKTARQPRVETRQAAP
ncbi:MAG TPA: ABC transporter permease subunit [Nocardioidaceae bacterium]|nr:ABC transporter permease subunit [Nocardioidaceae bacterium]